MPVSRRLTSGEIALAREIFGNSLDYSIIRVRDFPVVPWQPHHSGMTPRSKIYMRDCYREDYSKEDTGQRGFFIHEMAHAWQFQNKILHPVAACAGDILKNKFNYSQAYYFSLDDKKDLTHYRVEQQASIIESYYLFKNGWQSKHCLNNGESYAEKARLFGKVLEKFLKNPAYARQKRFLHPFKGKQLKP